MPNLQLENFDQSEASFQSHMTRIIIIAHCKNQAIDWFTIEKKESVSF